MAPPDNVPERVPRPSHHQKKGADNPPKSHQVETFSARSKTAPFPAPGEPGTQSPRPRAPHELVPHPAPNLPTSGSAIPGSRLPPPAHRQQHRLVGEPETRGHHFPWGRAGVYAVLIIFTMTKTQE